MTTNGHTIIPENESHCVWMDAGLVNYKLCTCGFECDSCPFDSVMRAQHRTFAQRASEDVRSSIQPEQSAPLRSDSPEIDNVERLIAPFRSIQIPQDRIYFQSHTWMKKMNDGTVRVGIDEFLARLLQPVSAVAVVYVPSHISQGQPFAWFIRNGTTYAIHNDMSGITYASNPQLAKRPSLLTSDPLHEGWLMTLSQSCMTDPGLKFFTPQEYETALTKEVDQLSQFIRTNSRSSANVGTTMHDGGMRIENIEQFIGEKRYAKILSRLLSPR
ncbi:MAG: hypothetical protein ACOYNS_10555 [Bacteroidota bacterium]